MQAPAKYLERFPDVTDEKRRTFLAMLSAMDDAVGQVLAKLRERKLEENTLVFFLSDNGGPTLGNGSLQHAAPRPQGRDARRRHPRAVHDAVEGPAARRQGGRPAGRSSSTCSRPILAAAGADARRAERSTASTCCRTSPAATRTPIHETLYWRFGPRRAIRSGDWKLQWNGDDKPGLYDLAKDPGESTDLAAANPKVVEELMAAWKKWDAELMAPRWPGRLEGGPGE